MAINLNVNGNTAPLEAAVQAAVNRIRKTPIKVTVDDKGATQPLGNMKRGADEFSKSMEAANARIIAFGASMAIMNGVADSFKSMVKNMVEVEKSLADINVVMGLSSQNLDKFGDGLFKVAKETGAAFKIAADAATEYARQGLSVEESLKRTKDALILTRLTGMDSAQAVKALTAAMNTYGDQIKDTTQLVSKFAAVDVKFAVSAEDFADAISRTGQAARSAGVDIDELVGLVTAAQQKTARGGKVIGNSFKTIFTRIGRTDTLNQLEDLGIAVRDLEGNTIGAKKILSDLANTFDTLTAAQQAQIAQTVGGVFQINILKAVLSDAAKQNGILANATQISASATNEAIQKNEQLRDTMSAMATETGLALKQVSAQIGEIMLAPGMEKVLNIVKSAAEGLGDLLGTGESSGSSFAKGFLKGLGNIITGPGLVVMVAVFGKLLVKAAQYANDSLKSLIGVTSESQKQKSIQTSLVNLFSQSSALSKEMLRTDISRTEKEKIILGLLRAQVVEANALNAISKQAASTLYRQGYGSNLAPRKGRAGGHIPNFANPERAQAAQGGYAAGSIRSMSMPGEGSVIYNSAETVKNFAGFKQPAIMPPHSSKAGKNYQQAFGSIHGFDPYAAGGYVPNYAKSGGRSAKSGGRSIINKDKKMVVFAASLDADRGGKYAGINDDLNNIFSIKPKGKGFAHSSDPAASGFSSVNVPYFGIGKKDAQIDQHKDFQSLINTRLIDAGEKVAGEISTKIFGKNYTVRDLKEGDVAAASGNIFEAAIMALQDGLAQEARKKDPGGTALLDIPRAGRDLLWEVFGAKGFGGLGAEAKIALGGAGKIGSHLKSAAEKFYKIERKGADPFAAKKTNTSKTSDLRKGVLSRKDGLLFVNNKPWSSYNKDQTALLKGEGFTASPQSGKFSRRGLNSQLKAYGHIPNFANPLSDAIGRETEAGVPVSQIRVGSHGALMGKGNPLGLGVTNTHDEPNGLRDVFGAANGFVPNYAQDYFQASDLSPNPNAPSTNLSRNARLMNDSVASYSKALKDGRITQERMNEKIKSLGQKYNANESAVQKVTQANRTLRTKLTQSAKGMSSGMGGMGLMMGLPMLAGFIPGADKVGSGGNMASSALTGAATGAGIGMMFPGFGTAIGAVVGLLGGLISSLISSKEAIEQERRSRELNISKKYNAGLSSIASSSLSSVASKPAVGRYFSGYTPQKGETLADVMHLFSAPEEAIGKMQKGQSVGPLEMYKNNGRIQKHLKSVKTQAVKAAMVQQKTSKIKSQREKIADKAIPNLQKKLSGEITQQDYEKRMAIATRGLEYFDKLEDQVVSEVAKTDVSDLNQFQKKFPELVNKKTENFLGRSQSQRDIIAQAFRGSEEEMFSGGKNFADIFGSESVSGRNILASLSGRSDQQIEELFSIISNLLKDQQILRKQENEGIILRLSKEKILLSAQDEFAKSMNSSAYFNQTLAGEYKNTIETMSAYMSKEQIASLKLSEAKRLAAEKFRKSMSSAEFDSGKKLVDILTSKNYKTAFEQELFKEEMSEEEFSGLSLEEQKEVAREVGRQAKSTKEMNGYLRNSNLELSIQQEKYRSIKDLAELTAQQEKERSDELLRQKTGPQAFQYGFAGEQNKMRESASELDHQLGGIVATNFRDGLVSGMRAAINQAENLGDVLQGVAMNFLQAIQNAYLTAAANQIVGAIPMPGKSRGGSIRNYSRGGGVPAMVTDGEYVMSSGAASKYGGAFMHSLNAGGKIPGYSNGGAAPGSALASNFGGGRGYESGRAHQSQAMSGFFYSQSDNVGLGEDRESLLGVLAEEEKARQAAAAKKAKRKALYKQLIGTALSAAVSYGVGSLNLGGGGPKMGMGRETLLRRPASSFKGLDSIKSSFSSPSSLALQDGIRNVNASSLFYNGGPIRKYASGGHIAGKSGIDQIPAMLSEGEYVIRASSARQIGKPTLDRINTGKFNDGGDVSPLNSSSDLEMSGGNTNNINISINLEAGKAGSSKSSESESSQSPVEKSNSEQSSTMLAEKIKQQVVSVIVEEQRPGGLLSD